MLSCVFETGYRETIRYVDFGGQFQKPSLSISRQQQAHLAS